MSLPVHLVPSLEAASAGSVVVVEGDEAHHAVAVRRLRSGERVALTDGLGHRAVGEVVGLDRRRLEVRVETLEKLPRPEPAVTVVQALPKGERGELAVELLTEVGVDRIVPWAAARSVAVWRGDRAAKALARWRRTAQEAAKQARRSWFPVVDELASTDHVAELVARAASLGPALVLHEEAAARLPVSELADVGSVLVVVGPEGGLTAEELDVLEAAGAKAVRLGPEVLRTSTAGVAAVAAVLAGTRRWR